MFSPLRKETALGDPNAKYASWTYRHAIGRNSTCRVKYGIVFGKIRHTYRHWRHPGARQMALVHFVGNQRATKVPYDELTLLSREEFEAQS